MHLDAAFARRTQMGAPVVHGIHTLAWAADAVLRRFPLKVANIRARFLQPLYLDEPASIRIREQNDRQIEFEVVAANTVVALIRLSSEPGKSAARTAPLATSAPAPISQPVDVSFEQLAGQAGAVATGDGDVRSHFPALSDSHRRGGRQGAAGDLADCRHGVPGTALAVCRARGELRCGHRAGRRPRLCGEEGRRAISIAANRRAGLRHRRPAGRLCPAGPAIATRHGRNYRRALREARSPDRDRSSSAARAALAK